MIDGNKILHDNHSIIFTIYTSDDRGWLTLTYYSFLLFIASIYTPIITRSRCESRNVDSLETESVLIGEKSNVTFRMLI